jgi:hypothetical protein
MTYPGPVYSPGYPQPVGQPQQPPLPQGYQYAQQPGYAPQPIYPAPQYQQQPPQLPQQFQGQDLNTRLNGAGIPQELQGKTVGEALRYYGIMREDFIRRQQQQPQQLQGQPQGGQQQYQQPQGGQQQYQQPQGGQPSAQPRVPQQQQDPMRQMIREELGAAIPQALAPITGPLQQDQLAKTYHGVRQRYQDWQHYDAEIQQSLNGAPMETLLNPNAWEAAYFHAKGKRATFPQAQQVPQQGYQPYPSAMGYQPQQQFSQVQQQPPQQFQPGSFVEGPTPPAPQFGPSGQNDPRDEVFARRFGIPVEVYRAAKVNPDAAAIQTLRSRMPVQQNVQTQQGPPLPGYPPQQQQQQFGYPQQPGYPQQGSQLPPFGPNGQVGQYGF